VNARHTLWWSALAISVAGACGPDGCVKPVKQCPPGVKCISYDEYCDQAPASLWTMGQVCGVIAKDVPYPAAYPQRDVRCTGELAELIDAGTVNFNAVAAELCIESRKTTCDPICRWDLPVRGPWAPARSELTALDRCSPPCDRIFTGTRETGEQCSVSAECLDGLWCDTSHGCPGRCARQISAGGSTPSLEACRSPIAELLVDGGSRCDDLVDAGAGCAVQDDEVLPHHCQPGYACRPKPPDLPDSGDGGIDDGGDDAGQPDGGTDAGVDAGEAPLVCIPWPDAGVIPPGRCSLSGCPYGQYCNGDVCVAFGDRGAECSFMAIDYPLNCKGGLQCVADAGTHTCGSTRAGDSCADGSGNLSECPPGAYCGADGGCITLSAVGSACFTSRECALGLICITSNDAGTCFTPSLAGQACGDPAGHQCGYGFECHDGGCVVNTCLPSP
jgi:hypothetical protein